jgi:nitroreductase
MKPRRGVFALDYIRETVDAYINSLNHQDDISSQELKWAHDVLEKYFEVTDSHPKINNLREKYVSIESKIETDNNKQFIPYKRILGTQKKATFDSFSELAKLRRSVRWFRQKKVPRELVDKAIEVASLSPSACNRQPFEYIIIDEKKLLEKVVQLPMGTGGYSGNIPMMLISIGNLDAYFSERDRHLIYIDASLANMSLMYALETLGLSSCPINWPDVESREKKMAELLNLKVHQRPIMCMAVGYPDPNGMVAYSQKKDLNLIRSYNNVD